MGTRSHTYIYEKGTDTTDPLKPKPWKRTLVKTYKQFDGYPSGYGMELATFLNSKTLVNGIGMGEDFTCFNGGGCLAAQVITHFKNSVSTYREKRSSSDKIAAGGYYIAAPGKDNTFVDYVYEITVDYDTNKIYLTMRKGFSKGMGRKIFEGTPAEVIDFINKKKELNKTIE